MSKLTKKEARIAVGLIFEESYKIDKKLRETKDALQHPRGWSEEDVKERVAFLSARAKVLKSLGDKLDEIAQG